MTDLVDTTEMYLRTILDLEEEQILPMRARISERLGHSGPTVSQTIARMERDGLVVVEPDRRLRLTEDGRGLAVRVSRKHRLAERLLADVIGLEWSLVHEEACRWEHVMSEQVERQIFDLLGKPVESPYGTPIPGLDELGVETDDSFLSGVARASETIGTARVRRLAEPLQFDVEVLRLLEDAGIMPGALVEVDSGPAGARVTGPEGVVDLDADLAIHLYLAVDTQA
ncbi:metal-dependent transcriptional regulator [Agrococcus casei]|uniref:Iron-dependent repressor IdeR/DtxR n=1 Tax=Agrococcus casei LMG 22410 TaxID=1255656 RepID=A0A1R4GCP4_9MICO|nr:metal-dependent transcriptional regulator [Agrococcus casei]SJM65893.1 Iron-dependent repressor IdeR/DtxR [Agrococcus casei LMG 22410]